MKQFTFEWEDNVKMNKITPKWIAKLVIWSIVVAYLPNIIWYFAGYPLDAVLMQFAVMTIGMPPIIILSMRGYRKYYSSIPLRGNMWMEGGNIVITKVIMSPTLHRYIEVWKSGTPLIEKISINKSTGEMSIMAMFHVEAYTRKRNGKRGALVAADSITRAVDVKVPINKIKELDKYLEMYYIDSTVIAEKG